MFTRHNALTRHSHNSLQHPPSCCANRCFWLSFTLMSYPSCSFNKWLINLSSEYMQNVAELALVLVGYYDSRIKRGCLTELTGFLFMQKEAKWIWLNVETRMALESKTLLITSSNRVTKVHMFAKYLWAGGNAAVMYGSGRVLMGRGKKR